MTCRFTTSGCACPYWLACTRNGWRVMPTWASTSEQRASGFANDPSKSEAFGAGKTEHPARLSVRRISQECLEGGDEVLRVAAAGTVVAPGRGEDDTGVVLTGRRPRPDDAVEVLDVLAHQCPSVSSCRPQQLLIRQCGHQPVLSSRRHVMALISKALGGSAGVVRVEQQLHLASRSCWRRQSASAWSAATRFACIWSSISSVNSA